MALRSGTGRAREAGFTLMELVVVLFIVGLLAAIAVPNVYGALQRAREAALLENLDVMRRSIDDFYGDRAAYPDSLGVLVDERYLRFVPKDPVGGEDMEWTLIAAPEGGIMDVRSSAEGTGLNGKPYSEW